jgi:hypothetical protein
MTSSWLKPEIFGIDSSIFDGHVAGHIQLCPPSHQHQDSDKESIVPSGRPSKLMAEMTCPRISKH